MDPRDSILAYMTMDYGSSYGINVLQNYVLHWLLLDFSGAHRRYNLYPTAIPPQCNYDPLNPQGGGMLMSPYHDPPRPKTHPPEGTQKPEKKKNNALLGKNLMERFCTTCSSLMELLFIFSWQR